MDRTQAEIKIDSSAEARDGGGGGGGLVVGEGWCCTFAHFITGYEQTE